MADNLYIELAQQMDEPPENPYIGLARQMAAEETRQAVAATADLNPDNEARVQQLARQYNIPPTAVRTEQPRMERRAELDAIDYELLARDNPKTAGFLSDPQKAAVARDDLAALKELERQVGVLSSIQPPEGSFLNFLRGAASSFGTGAELTRQGIIAQGGDLLGSPEMTQRAMRAAGRARFEQSLVDPQFQSSTMQGVYSGVTSVLQMAPGMAASIATRSPVPGLVAAGVQTEAEAYTRYRARGASPLQAIAGAGLEGATEVATEFLPMSTIVNKLGRTGASKFLTELLVKDMAGEQVATFVQDAVDTAIANPEKTWGEFFAERPDAAYQTAIATLMAGGAVSGAHVALNRMAGPAQRAQTARHNAEIMARIDRMAAASKLRERDPNTFQQFVERVAEDGSVQDLYVDPKALAQSGVDLNALTAASPSVAAQLQEAVAMGGDIKIPLSEYLTKLAGSDFGSAFADHAKTEPLGMSRAEEQEFFQTQGDQLKAEVERILTEKQQDDTFKQSQARVQEAILAQHNAVNRFTSDKNEVEAQVAAARYAVLAARLGIMPEQAYEKYGSRLQAQMPTGATLEQPAQVVAPDSALGYQFETGKAVTVEAFHGSTARGIKTLDMRNAVEVPGAVFFTSSQDTAEGYRFPREYGQSVTEIYDEATGEATPIEPGDLLRSRITFRNPLVVDFEGAVGDAMRLSQLVKDAKAAGHDGIVIRNVDDTVDSSGDKAVTYAVLDPAALVEPTTFDQEANGSTPYTEGTITVDGKERPTTNSNGQPIAATKEGLENFWRWFGDSKVVDGEGKPLVVYHGTDKSFNVFNTEGGSGKTNKTGAFFSSNPAVANTYMTGKASDAVGYPVYLSLQEPAEVDAHGANWAHIGSDALIEVPEIQASNAEDAALLAELGQDVSGMPETYTKDGGTYKLENFFPRKTFDDSDVSTDDIARFVRNEGYEGLIINKVVDRGPSGRFSSVEALKPSNIYVAFKPTQIKSVYNEGQFSPTNPDILHQSGMTREERDLLITHNLTEANLLHAAKMGGIPVPSLAVVNKDNPLLNFGDITLIGPPEMADPKGYARTKVFGADIYSPRYPGINYKVDPKKVRALEAEFADAMKATGTNWVVRGDEIADKGHEALQRSRAIQYQFIKDHTGQSIELTDEQRADTSAFRANPWDTYIYENKLGDEFNHYTKKLFEKLDATERIYKGTDYNGNRRYIAHTLENVVKLLKKELVGGENAMGIGQARSAHAPQFKSVKQIREAKDRLVGDKEFEAVREEMTSEFFTLIEEFKPYYEYDANRFGYADTMVSVVYDAAKKPLTSALREYGFENVPDDVLAKMRDYMARLKTMPTEYFEAKILREVDLAEFAGAVVPSDTSQEALDALRARGVTNIKTYKRGDEADRKAQIASFDNLLFQSVDTDPDAAPWYYSQVQKVVENLKLTKAPGEQWLKTIQNTPGVKQEELDWMGLPEWLAAQQGPVTKDALLAFVNANQIKVDEVVKGNEDAVEIRQSKGVSPVWQIVEIATGRVIGSGYDTEQEAVDASQDVMREAGTVAPTKFEQYVLPGGENYRELLMTLPNRDPLTVEERKELNALTEQKQRSQYRDEVLALTADQVTRLNELQDKAIAGRKDNYTSSHFGEKNILAHIRFNERTDADGKRVLFIEEIQSDWHQAGRDKGYRSEANAPQVVERSKEYFILQDADGRRIEPRTGEVAWTTREAAEQAARNYAVQQGKPGQVPDAPFKTTWPELAFKRALRWAVDNGFDRVAWTTGDQQADRYDLSKQVKTISWTGQRDGSKNVVITPLSGNDIEFKVTAEGNVTGYGGDAGAQFEGKSLSDIVGKDMAEKINAEKHGELSGNGLKVGGEGMRAFYDKMLPNMVNKMVKKWGGKVGETTLSAEDSFTRDAYDRPKQVKGGAFSVHSLDITPEMRAAAQAGLSLFQEKRGAYDPNRMVVSLLSGADLSTFLHEEGGHHFLRVYTTVAAEPNAPADIRDDVDKLLKWFGVEGASDVERLARWHAMTLDQQREYHEQFAEAAERYFFEGKAPSVELQPAFNRFAAWFKAVYKALADFLRRNSRAGKLNDEIRQVFDRMHATDQQIREAEVARSMLPMFTTAQDAGMTDEEFKSYYEQGLEATQTAMTELGARGLRDMKWLGNARGRITKALQKEAALRRKSVRDEVTREVLAEPVNQARQFLKRGTVNGEKADGPHKMDNTAVKEIAAASGVDLTGIEGKYGKYGLMAEGGLHPDAVAEMFGFSSGSELLRALATAEDINAKIDGITDQRMLERYGDLNSPEAIEQAANAAIHNEARTRFVATELNALQKALGSKKILAKAAKDYAATMVNRQRIRDLKPSRYEAAEARAAKASATAFKAGDIQTAAAEKKNQLVQTYAAKAAYEAVDTIKKGAEYLKKFTRDSIRKSVDPDYVDQIQAMLERFDLKERSLKDIDRRKSLAEWAKAQQEIGLDPDIPPAMLNEANRKNYREMTVEEFTGLLDTVKQIEHLGRLKTKLLTAADQRQFDVAISEMVERIKESSGGKLVDNRTRANRADKALKMFKGFMASHRKVTSLLREMDGWKDGGPLWEYFARSMNASGDRESAMLAKATREMTALLKPLRDGGKVGGKGIYIPEVGMSLNREELFMVAVNTGNAGNLQRLMDGRGWSVQQVQALLNRLTPAEADAVQKVWDYFETYRPQLGAVERALYGKEPEWVEPQPVTIGGVQLRGGYAPIVYDPAESPEVKANMMAEDAKGLMRGALRSSSTRDGMTKSRAETVTGKPLLLTMDGLFRGVSDTIHRIAWQEWVTDANRIVRNKSFSRAVSQHYGEQVYDELVTAVQDIATNRAGDPADQIGKALGHLRRGSSIAALGLNVVNSLVNLSGVSQTAVRIGPRWAAVGIGQFAKAPKATAETILEKSVFMQNRSRTYNRELNETVNQIRGQSKARQYLDIASYSLQTVTQLAVDMPTWWGAYQKALTGGNDEARAVSLADQAVLDAQTGGTMKDLARIQRGNDYKKLLTAFYGYFSGTYNLTVEATKKTDFKDPADVLRLARDYFLLYSVPVLWSVAIKTALTGGGDDDDEDKLLKRVLAEHVSYPMGMLVGVREATAAVQLATGTNLYAGGYGGPAGLRFFGELSKLGQQIEQGEWDRALARSAVNVAGITLHLPSGQVNRTIDGMIALSEGRTSNPLALLGGAPPKR